MPKKAQGEAVAEALVIPEAVQEELTLLRGFRDLVAERVAYQMGVKVLNEEIKEKTASERKAFNEASKYLKENIETFIKNADYEGYVKAVEDRKAKAKALREAKKQNGFDKVSMLRKGIKYIDNVAIPKSLETLGVKLQPVFSLSEYIAKAVEKKSRK